jgi:hypothetical protein
VSGPLIDAEVQAERPPSDWKAPQPGPVSTVATAPARKDWSPSPAVRPIAAAAMAVGSPSVSSAMERAEVFGNRALAEVSYRLRRLGATTLVGIAAVVAAATVYLSNNLPQGAAVTALRVQLLKLTPMGKGAPVGAPVGATLASLPARADAPEVVAKILEEAKAAGVELPRGQYEFVPPRDGVAARYRMTFPVHATYPQIREFIDRTLVALPAVAVEGLRIERKSVGEDAVDAELKLAAYVRSEP